MTKAQPTSIRLNRGEGPCHECNKPRTVATFREATAILQSWALTAPKGGGYDKCDFTVSYDNGDTYSGRFDLTNDHRIGAFLLEGHMTSMVRFYSGRGRPPHMTEERYRAYLACEHIKEPAREYAEFGDKCQIGDKPGDFNP